MTLALAVVARCGAGYDVVIYPGSVEQELCGLCVALAGGRALDEHAVGGARYELTGVCVAARVDYCVVDKQLLVKIRRFFFYFSSELVCLQFKLSLFLLIFLFRHGIFAAEEVLSPSCDEHALAPEHHQLRIVVHQGEPDVFIVFAKQMTLQDLLERSAHFFIKLGYFNLLGERFNVAQNGIVGALLVLV